MSHSKHDSAVQVGKELVWDIPVRVAHWVMVLSMIAAYTTHLMGLEYYQYHVISGYVLLITCVFRVLWGIFGTTHAKFKNFVRGPVTTLHYIKNLLRKRGDSHTGHNPLGAVMIIVLLSGLILQAMSGLFTSDDIFNAGPLFALVSERLSGILGYIHRNLFYWIVAFSLLHIGAVLMHWIFTRENLIKAMITGKKNLSSKTDPQIIQSSRLPLAILLLILLIALFIALLNWVQQIQSEYFY